jgi:hypothetical protein
MVNNVIGVVNYVIAARPSLRNFMIAVAADYSSDRRGTAGRSARASGAAIPIAARKDGAGQAVIPIALPSGSRTLTRR